jgi:hypothetical protein
MTRAKKASRRKGRTTALPVLGAVGVSLAVAGGASATAPADRPLQDTALPPEIFLDEEELSDVSLATFYVFDNENIQFGEGVKVAFRGCRGCGCRGCAIRGCRCGGCGCAVRVWRGCGGCGCGGCAVRIWRGCGCIACGGCCW